MAEQATLSTKEAAARLRCSEKRVRDLIRAGTVRAQLVTGRRGREYRIEEAGLPGFLDAPAVGGAAGADTQEPAAAAEALEEIRAGVTEVAARLEQLEGERKQRVALEERVRHLIEKEAQARAEADTQQRRADDWAEQESRARTEASLEKTRAEELGKRVAELQTTLRWRTGAIAILLLAVMAMLLRA